LGLLPKISLCLVGLETEKGLWLSNHTVRRPFPSEVLQIKAELTPKGVAIKKLLLLSLLYDKGLGALTMAPATSENKEEHYH
jgi:hypothetical protein